MPERSETNEQAFDRGTEAGRVAAELAQHGAHLDKINGSMDRVAKALEGLRADNAAQAKATRAEMAAQVESFREEVTALKLVIQGLGDSASADRSTVVATAAALKDADQARRDKTEFAWTPVQRMLGVGMFVVALVGLYLAFRPR